MQILNNVFICIKYFVLLSVFYLNAFHVIIIIPGTWATASEWYKPTGDFFRELKSSVGGDPVVAFNWSCKITYQERDIAASQLVTVLDSYPEDTEFTIIAHSHGGNVGIVASKQISRSCIRAFYALGTPVNNESYYPNMKAIKGFYNLFSWEDMVQPLVGYKRIYNYHPRVWNISIKVSGKSPLHSDLHHPLVARWIFYVEKVFKDNLKWLINFKAQDFDFCIESDRDELLEFDEAVVAKIPDLLVGRSLFQRANSPSV